MYKVPLSKTKIESKIAVIREALTELEKLGRISEADFIKDKTNFAVAEHHLRRALEAVFDIAAHIISRLPFSPGKRPASLKGFALALVDKGIIDKEFGREILTKMAGYRNRMVHFYDEIKTPELYQIITQNLTDIETFVKAVLAVLKNPEKFNLELED
jgi:uncharacterized protein YutE (UPF0331/DUF86 family)